ncbi:MAG TPA: PVC-type heme-binding CxxCH protein [Verrucomicrobiae bacterium]
MHLRFLLVLALAVFTGNSLCAAAPVPLFDGKTFNGWEGETNKVWRVQDGTIVGGTLNGNPQNEFLTTKKTYRNFNLTLEYKLVGTEGFVNGGVQFRSKRIPAPPNEMSGYQADIGATHTGSLYDESRRKKMLYVADKELILKLEKTNDWNTYQIIAEGQRVRILLNGRQTADYTERESGIEQDGVIALQIHGNCKAEIAFRNINIETLPDALVPSEPEILGRFGEGQPGAPMPGWTNGKFELGTNETIVFIGQENFVREQKAAELESLLAAGFNTKAPRFRFMSWEGDTVYEQWRDLNFGSWAAQLNAAGATTVIVQYGQMESLDGTNRLTEFTIAYHRLLDQFNARTKRLVLVSPMPFEKPLASHAPDISLRNADVNAYAAAIQAIAKQRGAVYVDLNTALSKRPNKAERLTEDGIHLTPDGLRIVAQVMAAELGSLTGRQSVPPSLREAIIEKNQLWFDVWRPANWSFVYGDRVSQMFGKAGGNSPSLRETFERYRPLIANADSRIHALARGEKAPPLVVPKPAAPAEIPVLSADAQKATFTVADGYEVNLFASEIEGIAKPTQFTWDERGRLYVACSPTYPQTYAAAKPADYIVVLEDTDGDGKADKSWRFAEGLTMIQGLETGPGGLYVCDFDQILFLKDTNNDGKADERKVLFSGFGIGDTHQLVNSISHGPDGTLWFTQGLHAFSRVETPWGLTKLDKAGVWRFHPKRLQLQGFFNGGKAGHNCWGVAFDDFNQLFHKTGDRPVGYWSVPGLTKNAAPDEYHGVGNLFDTSPKTTSLDIIGTKALPEDIQGCAVIGGYFGSVVELHRFEDSGSGFKTTQLPKLMKSSDTSFRPVDVSVGPDGAIYLADWFNPVIGHYQASYADPRRDKTHGRIWRITAKGRPTVKQPNLAAMKAEELVAQLASPERWTRYQAKRLLFYTPTAETLRAVDNWVAKLTPATPGYERLLLEAIGIYEAHETTQRELLGKLLAAKDPRVRAYGTRVIGNWATKLPNAEALLNDRIRDENARVRLEAVVAASYVTNAAAAEIITKALDTPRDRFLDYALAQSARSLKPVWEPALAANQLKLDAPHREYLLKLSTAVAAPSPGRIIYEMACLPCHQPDGKGLAGVYPSLVSSDWLKGDTSRLIKVVLHGLEGPITLNGQPFVMQNPIPMPSMAGLEDQQIADVLTYIRTEFNQSQQAVTAAEVKAVRAATTGRETPWKAEELK